MAEGTGVSIRGGNLIAVQVALRGTGPFVGEASRVVASEEAIGRAGRKTAMGLRAMRFESGMLGTAFGHLRRFGKYAAEGIVAAGVGALYIGMKFEQAMATVKSVTSANVKNMGVLSQLAITQSTQTQYSASQAANAEYLLGRASFKTQQIIAALPATLDLATASGADLALTTTLLGETMLAFDQHGRQARGVADILALATKGGAMSMDDLNQAMKYVGAAAYGTHQKLADLVGLMKLMALHGVKGSLSGTTLRYALVRLIRPTRQVSDGLDLINIKSRDLYGPHGLRPLPDILSKMYTHLQALDKVTQGKAIVDIFGVRAYTGMLALFNQGPKAWNAAILGMRHSGGTAKWMADQINNTVEKQLLRFWHTLEDIGIIIYGMFSPNLLSGLKQVNAYIARFTKYMGPLQDMAKKGQWDALIMTIDNIAHAHGHLEYWIYKTIDAAHVLWQFASVQIIPAVRFWGRVIAIGLVGALLLFIGVIRFANQHTTITKILIYTLIGYYLIWKAVTFGVMVATKLLRLAEIAWWITMKLLKIMIWAVRLALIAFRLTIIAVRFAIMLMRMEVFLFYGTLLLPLGVITLIIVVIAALAIGFYLLYTRNKQFHHGVIVVWSWIKAHWVLLAEIFLGPIVWAIEQIIKHWGDITYFFTHFGSSMKQTGKQMWGWMTDGFTGAINWVIDQMNSVINMFVGFEKKIPGSPDLGIGKNPIGHIGDRSTGATTAGVNKTFQFSTIGSPLTVGAPTASFGNLPPKKVEPVAGLEWTGLGGTAGLGDTHVTVNLDGKKVAEVTAKRNADSKARGKGGG